VAGSHFMAASENTVCFMDAILSWARRGRRESCKQVARRISAAPPFPDVLIKGLRDNFLLI